MRVVFSDVATLRNQGFKKNRLNNRNFKKNDLISAGIISRTETFSSRKKNSFPGIFLNFSRCQLLDYRGIDTLSQGKFVVLHSTVYKPFAGGSPDN